jgi:hypothetical protein
MILCSKAAKAFNQWLLDCNDFTESDEAAQRWQAKGIPKLVVSALIGTQAVKSRATKTCLREP